MFVKECFTTRVMANKLDSYGDAFILDAIKEYLRERSECFLLGSTLVSSLFHAYFIVIDCYFPLVKRFALQLCMI